jgi:hypothetical protein
MRTADAAYYLGVSQKYLKSCREFLIDGEDYLLGASRTAPIRWNVERVKKALHYRGKVVRQADQIIQELQES